MARPSKEPPSPCALLPALFALVRARGGDDAIVAARAGVDASSEAATAAQVGAALDAACVELGEPYLALDLPESLPFTHYGPAELVARACPTAGEALARIATYAPLVLPQLEGEHARDERGATLRLRVRGHPRGVGRAANEYAAAFALSLVRRAGAIAPTAVSFAHARPAADLAPLYRFFGTREIDFGAEHTGFAIADADARAPMQGGDARMLATAEAIAEAAMRERPGAASLANVVAARVEERLAGGCAIDPIAASLHMSARTLQRRLEDEGTSFSEVVDAVRARVAKRMVADPSRALGEIAYALGFADLATFSRAFKRWTGVPPGAWRLGRPGLK